MRYIVHRVGRMHYRVEDQYGNVYRVISDPQEACALADLWNDGPAEVREPEHFTLIGAKVFTMLVGS